MSYLKIPGPLPQGWAVLQAMQALLSVDSDVEAQLRGSGRVHLDSVPTEQTIDITKPWGRVVLRIPQNPFGEEANGLGRRTFSIILRAHVGRIAVAKSRYDPYRHLAQIHQKCYVAINGQQPDLAEGCLAGPILLDSGPDAAEPVAEYDIIEQRAIYVAVVDPKEPA